MLTDRDHMEETLRQQHELIEHQASELKAEKGQLATMDAALQVAR
jgi:hypothetical protein